MPNQAGDIRHLNAGTRGKFGMYRSAVFFFVLLALSAVAGFWPSYLSRLGEVRA